MRLFLRYYLTLSVTVLVYFNSSKILFDKIYDTTEVVVDELFHIPQGLLYCDGLYTHYDPKITTLPGLYIISTIFVRQRFPCETYSLRFVNLVASCVNLLLFASILKFTYCNTTYIKNVTQALTFALLPPLYFFSHVYYTDTLSLTFLLAFSRVCLVNRSKILIFLFGAMSVLMRQTNIVWIAMVFGHKILDLLIKSSRVFGNHFLSNTRLNPQSIIARDIDKTRLKRYYNLYDLFIAIMYHITTCFVTFFKYLTLNDIAILVSHSLTLCLFAWFVNYNGSIVLGDKTAHPATLHIPQAFYFLIFYGIFGLPCIMDKFFSTIRLISVNKFKVIIFAVLMIVIVHYNTIVHPYLLADNRHYTFYVWNRWYGKYEFAKYAMIPVYIFLLFNLYDNLRHQNCVSFLLPYSIAFFLGLCLQSMIEIRYFLVPYIILRLRFAKPNRMIVVLELLWYLIINVAMFYVFFTKEVMWVNFKDPQRIIW